MASTEELTSRPEQEQALRKQVRILAVASGVIASGAVMIPQLLPPRMGTFDRGIDPMGVFLALSFLTFVLGVATPVYAYARSVRIGTRMPAAAFAPLALLLAAVIGMALISVLRQQTREVQFTPRERPPVGTVPIQ